MKAVTLYFQNLEPNLCLSRFVLAFLPFIVDLTFGKILNIYEKSHSRYLNSQLRIQIVQLTCKRFHFCKCPSKCPLKNTEQMTWKKLVQGSHASSNLLPFFSRSLILLDSPFFFLKNTNVSSNLLGVFLTVTKIF